MRTCSSPDPDADERQLRRVLALVALDQWITDLPHGLDTRVGQLGDAVSGGERQRIALARLLLSTAPILVLDEPTAHLGTATAATVEQNLRRELDGRTVVWIRHAYDRPANRPQTTPAKAGTLAAPSPDHLEARGDLVAVFEAASEVRG